MKKSYFIILFIFIFGVSIAQNIKVQGVVTDSLGVAIEMANVMAINTDQDKMDGYSITGNKGQFLLNLKPNTNYQLKVSYLGFSPKNVELKTENENIFLPILLEGNGILMEGVEITHEMPVSIKGDTIVYNADSFTSGTERKLEDVLKKMPGIEVDDDGGVKVEGKNVNKLMVDGKDFFDGDTKLGVQNIPADAVDKVQVLRNYNEVDQLKSVTDNQDNLAMNIKLKEGKKNFWFGDITAGGGDDERYVVNPKLFYYSKKYSLNFITNINNTGERPMTQSDYFRMTGGLKSLMRKGGSRFSVSSNDLDISSLQNNRAKEITNRFGAGNFSYNPTAKWTLTGFGVLSDNKTDMETWYQTSIIDTQTKDVITREESDTKSKVNTEMAMLKLSSNYKPNKKITFDYDLFFKKSQQREDYNLDTQVTPQTTQSQSINTFKKQNPLSYNQNISLYYAPNNKHVFAFETQHLYQDEDPFYNANLQTKPFDFADYIDGQLRENIYQERFLKTNKIESKLDYYYALTKKSNLNITLGNTSSHQNFNSHIFQVLDNQDVNELNDEQLNNRVTYAFEDSFVGLHYKIVVNKLTFNAGFSSHYYSMNDRQQASSNRRTFTKILPDFNLRYQIKKMETLTYDFAMTNNFTDILNLAEGYVLRGYSSLYRGNRNLENSTAQSHNLHYTKFNMFSLQTIYSGINYTRTVDNINSIAEFNGINRTSSSFNSNFADHSLSSYIGYGRTFARYYKANANVSVGYSKYNIMQTNPANNITTASGRESYNQYYSASIRSTFEEVPNLELGYAISINDYPEEIFYRSTPSAKLDYYFLKGFSLTADYRFTNYYNKGKTIDNKYDFLDASLSYKHKNSSWEYRVSATNILNTKNLNSDSFSSFSFSTSQYVVQPRYLIFSLKYNL